MEYGANPDCVADRATSKANAFRFLDLPQELKDQIYAYIYTEAKVSGNTLGWEQIGTLSSRNSGLEHAVGQPCNAARIRTSFDETSCLRNHRKSIQAELNWGIELLTHPGAIEEHPQDVCGCASKCPDSKMRIKIDLSDVSSLCPRLNTLKVAVVATTKEVDAVMRREGTVSKTLNIEHDHWLVQAILEGDNRRIEFTHFNIICSRLFEPRSAFFEAAAHTRLRKRRQGQNLILYKAVLSSGPYTWNGLDLEVIEKAVGSFEAAVAEARKDDGETRSVEIGAECASTSKTLERSEIRPTGLKKRVRKWRQTISWWSSWRMRARKRVDMQVV